MKDFKSNLKAINKYKLKNNYFKTNNRLKAQMGFSYRNFKLTDTSGINNIHRQFVSLDNNSYIKKYYFCFWLNRDKDNILTN